MEKDKHFRSIWIGTSVRPYEVPWQPTRADLWEERRFERRARRLRARAEREGWTASELYTAINNGCRIGRVNVMGLRGVIIRTRSNAAELLDAIHRQARGDA